MKDVIEATVQPVRDLAEPWVGTSVPPGQPAFLQDGRPAFSVEAKVVSCKLTGCDEPHTERPVGA